MTMIAAPILLQLLAFAWYKWHTRFRFPEFELPTGSSVHPLSAGPLDWQDSLQESSDGSWTIFARKSSTLDEFLQHSIRWQPQLLAVHEERSCA